MIIKFQFQRILFFLIITCLLNSCKKDAENFEEGPEIESSIIDPDNIAKGYIDTKGNTIVDEPKSPAELLIIEKDSTLYDGPIGIEIRGSSSQMFPKKSYGFESWDEDGNDVDVSLAGFPKEEDWIFYGPYSDKSLLRNILICELSNDIGLYASRTKLIELYINNQYKGVYVFMEKMKRDKNRINISKNKSGDISGGYIIKIDKSTGNGTSSNSYSSYNSFMSEYNTLGTKDLSKGAKTHFLYDYPKAEDIDDNQKSYIKNYISEFEDALTSGNFKDIDEGYQKWIDVNSFVDFFILNEISKNVDGYRLSTYMNKDKGGKLKMGPIWDFNLGFGNADYCKGGSYEGWAYKFNNECPGDLWQVPFWWDRLMEDPFWKEQIKKRWTELRSNKFSNKTILDKISNYFNILNANNAHQDNFNQWKILGKYVWPNNYIGTSYVDEIDYLQSWTSNRMNWMDGQINSF